MRLKAIALDYDGTIAENDRLVAGVRDAIARARDRGLIVIIVTGRILSNLRRVFDELTLVDAVVAENGAVVAFPASGRSAVLHDPPAAELLDALRAADIAFEVGEVVIEADAGAARRALEAVRALEQPLVIQFNRSRMMILPQAVSKASGLAAVLDALRLSAHNVLAIGDAENDHALLGAAEIGVAVEWGSTALKARADEILRGAGPVAVAEFIDTVSEQAAAGGTLAVRRTKRRATLGVDVESGAPLSLALTGRDVLICGDPRSGKSWVAGLLCEQLILQGYSVCVIDPEGDYASLETLPRVVVVGGDDAPPTPHELLRLLRYPDRSLVIDLSRLSHAAKIDYVLGVMPMISRIRQSTGLPHRLLLDEAHYFLNDTRELARADLTARGFILVTYMASRLHPDALREGGVMLVTRATDPKEIESLADACGARALAPAWEGVFSGLAVDEAALLPGADEADGKLRRIRLAGRLTSHVRHRNKYVDVPVAARHAFVFATHAGLHGEKAATLREFVQLLDQCPAAAREGHVRRGDFSRWILDVFGDRSLASTLGQLEENWRLGRISDINGAIIAAVRERYEFEP